jgi:hypothetical protein
LDAAGHLDTTSAAAVTLTLNPGNISATVNAVNGVAFFQNLSTTVAGTYTLTASSSGFTNAVTSSFVVSAAYAAKLVFLNLPASGTTGAAIPAFNVAIQDLYGNVWGYSYDAISLSSSPAGLTATAALSNGIATFNGVIFNTAGTYTLTASFQYGSTTLSVSSSPVTITGINTYSIAGQITARGLALRGVNVALSGSRTGSTVTDDSGNYSFAGLSGGQGYTVTPSLTSYNFVPPNQSFANITSHQTANFIAVNTVFVTGKVTSGTTPLANVAISVSGTTTTTVSTNGRGEYAVSLAAQGTYTFSAALSGYIFSAPVTLTNITSDQTANFTGSPTAATLPSVVIESPRSGAVLSSGTITLSGWAIDNTNTVGTAISAVQVNVDGVPSGTATYGGARPDVCAVYAGRAGCPNVGYSYSLDTSKLTSGSHTLTVTATDTDSIPQVGSASLTVTVASSSTNIALSGQITGPSGPISGATINVNGSASSSVIADSSGHYSIKVGQGGSYMVSAAASGFSFSGPVTLNNVTNDQTVNFAGIKVTGLQFFAVTPCRVTDTRPAAGFPSQFGPPTMAGGQTRTFPVPLSACGIPSDAAAYSLNFTVVPPSPGGYVGLLTTYPTGQPRPNASTLNSYTGTVVANAAIVPAGANGSIDVYVSERTDVLFDINGYFAPESAGGVQFYAVSPCRVADTRPAAGFPSSFGAPTMTAGQTRTFPVPSGACGIPSNPAAYSLNFTVVPPAPGGYLGLLTTWPLGPPRPNASTLNSYTGTVVANAAIVPAGTAGAVNVYVSDRTDVLFDVNGYFGSPSASGLNFYPVSPCRIADTRPAAGFPAPFGSPTMTAGQTRTFPVPSSSCGIPPEAKAYSLNFTVVPPTPGYLGLLTTWPAGQGRPNASTLNSYTGTVVANAAIVPAGTSGAISVYVSEVTDVIFDIDGYFAP